MINKDEPYDSFCLSVIGLDNEEYAELMVRMKPIVRGTTSIGCSKCFNRSDERHYIFQDSSDVNDHDWWKHLSCTGTVREHQGHLYYNHDESVIPYWLEGSAELDRLASFSREGSDSSFFSDRELSFFIGDNPPLYSEIINRIRALKQGEKAKTKKKPTGSKKEKGEMYMFDFDFDMTDSGLDFGMVNKTQGVSMSPYGLAVCDRTGRWLAYDKEAGMFDVTGMTFDLPIMRMPVGLNQIQIGSYVDYQNLDRKSIVFVTEVSTNYIKGIRLADKEEVTVHPAKNMFGFNFFTSYQPLVSMSSFGSKPDPSNPFGNIMPLMMMSEMFGKDSKNSDDSQNGGFMEKMFKFQMMSSMIENTRSSGFNLPFIGFNMGEEIDLSGSND